MYLRVTIDSENGIDLSDCEKMTRAIDPLLDEADPIDVSYYLEVCSPGLERQLVRDAHFEWAVDEKVKIKLFKAIDGKKELEGILKSYEDGKIVLKMDLDEITLEKNQIAKANLMDFDE